ncbi:MAG TPA: ATP-grasp domain-containing protein [Dongiaceae bacterium]
MSNAAVDTSLEAPLPAASAVPGALVLGGAHGSLAVARSLGRRGIPVWHLTHDHQLARFSRYVARCESWPGPDDAGAVEWLCRFVRHHGLDGWILFACGDPEVQFCARNHAVLSSVLRLSTPPWAVTRWTVDKRMTYQHADQIGVHVPRSHYPQSCEEAAQLDCRFPVILKPAVHEQRNAFTQAKAWRADDREMLKARFAQAAALVGEQAIVVQELIPGDGQRQFSYAVLCDRGVPTASLVARRRRQFPIEFGYTSTFVETIEQPEVETAACRILRSLELSGLVEVEFKYDVRDSHYKLLDINARPWTWIGLGNLAGVDFPFLAWRFAQGETVAPVRGRPGVGWMHVTRDMIAACHEIWNGVSTPSGYLRSLQRPLTLAAFAKDDPLPGLIELPLVAARVLARSAPLRCRAPGKTLMQRPGPTGRLVQ